MRRGTTVAEVLIALAVGGLALACGARMLSGSAAGSARAAAACDSARSVLLASEALRADLAGVALEDDDADLVVLDGGHALSMRTASAVDGDPWTLERTPVTWRLVDHRLVRTAAEGAGRPLPGCRLDELAVRVVDMHDAGSPHVYLEITLVGEGDAERRFASSMLVAVNRVAEPPDYRILEVVR